MHLNQPSDLFSLLTWPTRVRFDISSHSLDLLLGHKTFIMMFTVKCAVQFLCKGRQGCILMVSIIVLALDSYRVGGWNTALAHSGSNWLKPAKNKFTWCYFTRFSMQVSSNSHNFRFRSLCALHIQNLSNCCRHNYDPSISRIFHSNIWRVFDIWTKCVAQCSGGVANHTLMLIYDSRAYFWL